MKTRHLLPILMVLITNYLFAQDYRQYFDSADTICKPSIWQSSICIAIDDDSTNIWQIGVPQKMISFSLSNAFSLSTNLDRSYKLLEVYPHSSTAFILTDLNTFNRSTVMFRERVSDLKKKQNLDYVFEQIKETISPLLSYKTGGTIVAEGDSVFVRSIELGFGLTNGFVNEWVSWGPLPMGFDWGYITLPYITAEYRWFNTYYRNSQAASEPAKLKNFMLNLGVSGGIGGILTLLPVPFGINGSASLSTDFKDLYARGRLGWDIAWVSVGVGGIYNLTEKSTAINNSNYIFLELAIHPWRSY